jgi:hypothetical protein
MMLSDPIGLGGDLQRGVGSLVMAAWQMSRQRLGLGGPDLWLFLDECCRWCRSW